MTSLLVIDVDPLTAHLLRRGLQPMELAVHWARSAAEGIKVVVRDAPDVVLLDMHLPDQSGPEALAAIRRADPCLPVIFTAAAGSSAMAIEAIKAGAFDYVPKPLNPPQIRELLSQAIRIRRFVHVPAPARPEGESAAEPAAAGSEALVGRSPAMQEVYKAIGRVASQNVNVLVRGESGTGKELVARAIYQHSPRAAGRFLAVNCAAIPEPLLESELFGHEKGAFTGAENKRVGKFELCSGGTLFLDEIGDMTPLMQSKVLRVLQEQRFERVGGNETIQTDVWIIAATNRHLEQMLAEGQFRADLYYRLNGYSIKLPPLRARGDDIPLLVEHFLALFNRELGKNVHLVPAESLALLEQYSWPGNVRELQSVLRRALLQATGPLLLPEFLPFPIRRATEPRSAETAARASGSSTLDAFIEQRLRDGSRDVYAEALAFMERFLLTRVLRETEANQSRAAHILGITRGSLRTKIRTLGIAIHREVDIADEPPEAAVVGCSLPGYD